MPWSSDEGKQWAVERIVELKPTTILDVGPGGGTWAQLLRPHLPAAHLVGLEIFEPYRHTYKLDSLYDRVDIGDARAAPNFLYDVVIFGDVLEHMTYDDAAALVGRAKADADAILVSCPIVNWPQGELEGNPHEAHLYTYTPKTLGDLVEGQTGWIGEQIGCVLWTR